ncbi:hypothetical protein [Tropicibacter sp. S64]|uniref:hypothetical protein n=1 Tax=Tropicibacter sp. S64 TaxID=3415122 RepID=UPI003C7A7A03
MLIVLAVTVFFSMGITAAITGSELEKPNDTYGAWIYKLIGWFSGTISAGSLSVGGGWLMHGLSEDYWGEFAKTNYVWGLGIGAIVCAGANAIVAQKVRSGV